MRTFVSSLLSLGILIVSGARGAEATPRAGGADQPPLHKGKVLILKNEFTIQGDIERVSDGYCIRGQRGETWVPTERVLTLVASLPDAYAYLRGRINLGDPDERLRLARWCWDNGLQQQALAELKTASQLRPAHAETRRLLLYWQQAPAKTTASTAQRAGSASDGKASLTNASGSTGKPADPPPIEVTTESLGMFATRVQPILMNTCARCHATGHGGNFHLTQVFGGGISNQRTLERNLAAVLGEVDVNQPETSRLLIKAVSDHAHTGQAPLRDRLCPPYRTLENWVKLTVADNPQLRGKSETDSTAQALSRSEQTKDSAKSPFEGSRTKGGEKSQWGTEARPRIAPASSPVSRGGTGKAAPPPSPTKGSSVSPVDPYDPEPFNRKMHPEANKMGPGGE
jgi:hypothetical protein